MLAGINDHVEVGHDEVLRGVLDLSDFGRLGLHVLLQRAALTGHVADGLGDRLEDLREVGGVDFVAHFVFWVWCFWVGEKLSAIGMIINESVSSQQLESNDHFGKNNICLRHTLFAVISFGEQHDRLCLFLGFEDVRLAEGLNGRSKCRPVDFVNEVCHCRNVQRVLVTSKAG